MKPGQITVLTFGYWGWGNQTKKLIDVIDAAEQEAGFAPPVFLDIRFNRSVRAKGFNGDSFEKLVGADRYHHIKSLGNARIGSGRSGIKIQDPSSISILLDRALAAAEQNRRVIFFCACPVPFECHRRTVARLLEEAGMKRRIKVTCLEWPGGQPEYHEVAVGRDLFKKAVAIRSTVPIPKDANSLKALPWYSVVKFVLKDDANSEPVLIFTGPAVYRHGWCFPVLEEAPVSNNRTALQKESTAWRKKWEYESP